MGSYQKPVHEPNEALDELFDNPAGTTYSAWRYVAQCRHTPFKDKSGQICGLPIYMKFAEAPEDYVGKIHHAVYETDKVTVHVHRQERTSAPATQIHINPPKHWSEGTTTKEQSELLKQQQQTKSMSWAEKDKAIQAMHDEKKLWHEQEMEQLVLLNENLRDLVTVAAGLCNAIDRFSNAQEEKHG